MSRRRLGALALVATALGAALVTGLPEPPFMLAANDSFRVSAVLLDTAGPRGSLAARIAAEPNRSLEVIVRWRAGQERRVTARIVRRARRRLALDRSVVARLTGTEVRQLAASGLVESIEIDGPRRIVRGEADASFGSAKARLDFGLTGDGDGDPTQYTARDSVIAVIDTGIDAGHQEFAGGKVIAWQDFVNGRPRPYDDQGHGTHVASIAAGSSDRGTGVAPGAALIGLKVADAEGVTSSSRVAEALEWCITHQETHGIEVINLSLAGAGPSDGAAVDDRMVDRAVAAGIVVCVAAGNDGPEPATIGSPGAAAGAITVGSMADPGRYGFFLDPASARGPTLDGRMKPDLCAPGVEILAAQAGTVSGYERRTGTSMASPFAAGVCALLRAVDPALTPPAGKAVLKETAVPFGRPRENNEYGAGRLDAYAALARAAGGAGATPAQPGRLHRAGRLAGPGDERTWKIPIGDTGYPVAVSLIVEAAGADFDLAIYDPDGDLIALSSTESRQELAAFMPVVAGIYRLVVSSYAGSGDFSLDVSAGIAVSEGDTEAAR